jgi:hypothetical protein
MDGMWTLRVPSAIPVGASHDVAGGCEGLNVGGVHGQDNSAATSNVKGLSAFGRACVGAR